jgi:hypothetical protein
MLFALASSCTKKANQELNSAIVKKSIFSPILEREILKIIAIKNQEVKDEYSKPKVCNVVILQDITKDGICVVHISYGNNSIVQKTRQFIPPPDSLDTHIDSNSQLINGYTFWGKELIICCVVSESCNNNLINEQELIPIKDSIPGYPNIPKSDLDGNYHAPTRIYKIINADSLQLIESAFMPKE